MERLRRFLPAIGAGLLMIILIIFGLRYFKEDPTIINADNISVFKEDQSTYYLKNTSDTIRFEVKTTNDPKKLNFTLVDEDEQPVNVRVKDTGENTYEIQAPRFGYTPGKRYKLSLDPGVTFTDEHLEPTNTLVFVIDRKPIEHYKFTDAVIEVEKTIVETEENIIQVDSFQGQPDDIIFGLNQDADEVIYKIIEIQEEGSFLVEYPALDEIYAELEIHGEYELDFNDIVSNPELEAEVVKNIKESSFYSSLVKKAYSAADQEDIDLQLKIIEDSKTKDLQFEIIFTLKPGDDGLFSKIQFKEHEIELTLISQIGASIDVDIQNVSEWDISATRAEEFEWTLDIDVVSTEKEATSQLKETLEKDNTEEIKDILKALNEVTSDEAQGKIDLFHYDYRIKNIPVFIIGTDIQLALDFNLSTNLEFENAYSTATTTGLIFIDQMFTPYSSVLSEGISGNTSLTGSFDSKVGLNFDFYAMFFSKEIAHMSIKPEVGLYAEGYAGYTMFSDPTIDKAVENHNYGYFEPGLYFKGAVEGHLNLVLDNFEYLYNIEEEQFVFDELTFGNNKIVLGIEADDFPIYIKNEEITPPDFTLGSYDVRSNEYQTEKIDFGDLNFYFSHNDKKMKKKEDQLLILETDFPKNNSNELMLIAKYEDADKQIWESEFSVLLSSNTNERINHEAFDKPMDFLFASGSGGWSTGLTLASDGSFKGTYSDTNLIDGPGYSAMVAFSKFTGQFENIEEIENNAYSMELSEITLKNEVGEEWIKDEMLFLASTPYGIEGGKQFILYPPGTPTSGLSENFLIWSSWFSSDWWSEGDTDFLPVWALHNVNTGEGFYYYE